jgi:hypothetical protein
MTADMAGTVCSCSPIMFDTRGLCPTCLERQQKRHHRLSVRDYASSTPPSQPPTPRQSLDKGRPITLPYRFQRSPASEALQSAFSSEEEESEIFPPSIYRTSSRQILRKASRQDSGTGMTASGTPAERTTTIRHSQDGTGPVVGNMQRPATPGSSGSSSSSSSSGSISSGSGSASSSRGYSPMAAGFARLRIRDQSADSQGSKRSRSGQDGELYLSRRMFDGPA